MCVSAKGSPLLQIASSAFTQGSSESETTKLTQELAVKLEQGETFVSGTQWQTEK